MLVTIRLIFLALHVVGVAVAVACLGLARLACLCEAFWKMILRMAMTMILSLAKAVADVAVAAYLLYIPQFFPDVHWGRLPATAAYMARCAARQESVHTTPDLFPCAVATRAFARRPRAQICPRLCP